MKKLMALVLAVVLVVSLIPMGVSARTLTAEEKALFDELRAHIEVKDGEFHLPADVVTQGENYVASLTNALTPAQITEIRAQVTAAIAVVKAEETGVVEKWSDAAKAEILKKVDAAAKVVNCTAVADAKGGIEVKDAAGKTVVVNDELVKKTGFDAESMIVVGLCTITVLCACAFVSKKVELF